LHIRLPVAAFIAADELAPELAKRYPRQLPVTRLGRLAIRRDFQGRGLGLSVGSAGIFVDAKDGAAASFYQQYGFIRCQEQPLKLDLPMWSQAGADSRSCITKGRAKSSTKLFRHRH
jgi:hypothetical protein